MPAGWMSSGARIRPAPFSNYYKGREGQSVKAVVLHIAEGSYQGSANWLVNPASGVSAHFIVSRQGEITQMVSILDTAYTNGLSWNGSTWIDPEGAHVTPPWPGLTPPINPNFQTITVEHEGHSGDVWTPAMIAADVTILQFVHATYPLLWTPHKSLIGHYEISPVNRARCPGTGCPFDTIAAAATSGGGSVGPDYQAIWSAKHPEIAYNPTWGIPTQWRAERWLGAVLTPEMYNNSDVVLQEFENGWILYRKSTGKTQVLK